MQHYEKTTRYRVKKGKENKKVEASSKLQRNRMPVHNSLKGFIL